jgi:hypothetical protein
MFTKNNNYYANKEKRESLSVLSKKVFGTRSKWLYFVQKRGYTITAIEQQMKLLEVEIDKVIKGEQDDNKGSESINGKVINSSSKLGQTKVRIDRKSRRKLQRYRAKEQRKSNRGKARSEQTGPVVDTVSGISADSKST